MPALIALGAQVVVRGRDTSRMLPLEDFYLAYRKTALARGEFVARIVVPPRAESLLLRAYKVSKRYDQDISAVFACFALRLAGSHVASARIGCGGVAPIPARARRTEAALAGQPWTAATAERAAQALEDEFTPIDDMRASAAYRRKVLGNLLRRLWLERGEARAPTRVSDVAASEAR
jgi:xanthine dehydrogenase small subunit